MFKGPLIRDVTESSYLVYMEKLGKSFSSIWYLYNLLNLIIILTCLYVAGEYVIKPSTM